MTAANWMALPARSDGTKLLNVIVETPKGSRNKYRYDEGLKLFVLHKRLPLGAAFPFDFGFVPSTRAEDGDPLDVLVLAEEATFTGCLVTTRVLGVIQARQTEKGVTIRNDRIVGVAETPKIRPRERSLDDLPPGALDQIEHFFRSYNRMEAREFVPLKRAGPRAAAQLVTLAIRRFEESRGGD
jgi:inorganic pyrophosphatase